MTIDPMFWPMEVTRDIQTQLGDDGNPLTTELTACGPDLLSRLRLAAEILEFKETSREILDGLINAAQENLSSSTSSNTKSWRRLYTDSCLLRTLADITDFPPPDENKVLECIARLDQAIIVAGAAGDGRLDLTLCIIEKIQAEYLLHSKSVSDFSPSSKLSGQLVQLWTASKHIRSLNHPPSFPTFQNHLSQQPFILRGYAHDWPAMHERPWSSLDYLRFVAGPGRIVPVEVGKDYRTDDWTQKLMSWDEFLVYLEQSDLCPQREVLYLAQHSLLMQFPALRTDIVIPDYVYTCPPSDILGYESPRNEERLVINAWLGPKGTISPAHTDPYFNFYVQVVGQKTVWLAPPQISSFMYPYRSSPSVSKSHNPAANTTNPSMSNTSRVDVFVEDQSRINYPQFWDNVVPDATSATLEPGDMLFLPPGWWHAMRSEETSFSVSMWF